MSHSDDSIDSQPIVDIALFAAITPILLGLILLGAIIFDIAPGIITATQANMTAEAAATVTKTERHSIDGSTLCRARYKFSVDNRQYLDGYRDDSLDDFDARSCAMVQGQIIGINYNPNRPSRNIPVSSRNTVSNLIFAGLARMPISVLLIIVGSISVHSVRSMKHKYSIDLDNARTAKLVNDTARITETQDFSQTTLRIK